MSAWSDISGHVVRGIIIVDQVRRSFLSGVDNAIPHKDEQLLPLVIVGELFIIIVAEAEATMFCHLRR